LATYAGPFPEEVSESAPYSYGDLQAIQGRAFREHRYIPDIGDQWRASLAGDCEDFAIYQHLELAKRGIRSELVLAFTETGEGHVVTSVDGWILDNRRRWVRKRDAVPYRWLSIGSLGGKWSLIQD
jgi:predicted transglutaminase-like cysteine proteinase